MIEVKYVFLKTSGDPQEVTDITLKQERVPRIGELVDINVDIGDGETVDRMGRVDDVTWHVASESYAVVFIA